MADRRGAARVFGSVAAAFIAAAFVVVAGCAAAGCASEPTRIVVVTDSDLEVPAELAAVRFTIDSRGIGGTLDTRLVALDAGEAALPLVLPIVHQGGPLGPIVIAAEGLRGAATSVERSAELSFVAGRSIVLELPLEAVCAAGPMDDDRSGECGQGRTCAGGACASRVIDASTLPEWRRRDALAAPTDAGASIEPLPDAGAPGPPPPDDDD